MVIGHWSLVIGYWLLVIGYWLLVIGYWLLVIGYWLLVIGYWLLVIRYSLFVMLPFLLIAAVGYVVIAVRFVVRFKRSGGDEIDAMHPIVPAACGGIVPVVVALTMAYLFLIVGGSTTVQFNVGNASAMDVWSTWVGLWPMFLFLTLAGAVVGFVWALVCAIWKKFRPWLGISAASFGFSALAFFTVVSHFPSA